MTRRLALVPTTLALALAVAWPTGASAADGTTTASQLTAGQTASSNPAGLQQPASDIVAPPLHRLDGDQAIALAARVPKIAAAVRSHRGAYPIAYLKGPLRWQVSYYARGKEIAQVLIDDRSASVLEAWTGFQVAWTMARGYPGAFGHNVNALYVWLPLCLLFFAPFFDWRRPRRLLHLDLLVLLSFSVSLAFFNHGNIYASVPLAVPPLLYLLGRMLAIAWRPGRDRRPLRLSVPPGWLAIGLVFLIGFRIGLNVSDGNVIDVGYAGVIGAHKLVHGQPLYGNWPRDNQHGDTYGPVNYIAYVPAVAVAGWSGKWDDLPAAHLASVMFDLLAIALLYLLGRRVRGPTFGLVLAYAWAAYPFTLFAMESGSNDALVAVLVLAALLAATAAPRHLRGSAFARGMTIAWAGLTKFAPLALAPLLATYGLPSRRARATRLLALFAVGFALAGALALWPALAHDSVRTIWDRTVSFQDERGSPFSPWGLYGLPDIAQRLVQGLAIALALGLALLPRRRDITGLAAATAAILVALQLGITHWFYLYLPWFFGLAMLALLAGGVSEPRPPVPEPAAARSRQLVAA